VIASPLTQNACATLSSLLTILHVPSILHPSPEHFVTSAWCTFVTLTLYYGVLGRTHMNVRKTLRRDLKIAADRMMELEEVRGRRTAMTPSRALDLRPSALRYSPAPLHPLPTRC
jgi:hypothetical protein